MINQSFQTPNFLTGLESTKSDLQSKLENTKVERATPVLNFKPQSVPNSVKASEALKPKIEGRGATNLFSDEETALNSMISDGISEEKAREVITSRRKKQLGSITQEESTVLSKMIEDGVTSDKAVEIVRQNRNNNLPAYKKALKVPFDFTVGTLAGGVGELGGITDFITKGNSELAKGAMDARDFNIKRNEGNISSAAGRLLGEGIVDYTVAKGAGKVPLGKGKNIATATGLGKVATTTPGLAKQGAKAGALYGGLTEVGQEGSETTLGGTAKSAAVGGVAGGALPLAIPAVKSIKNIPKGVKDLRSKIESGELTQEAAYGVSERANRMHASDIRKFEEMTGEKPGQFAVDRGMTKTGEGAVEETADLFQKSVKEADDAFDSIDGNFTMGNKDVDFVEGAIEGLQEKLTKFSPDIKRVNELANKYREGGLSMSEINELKRLYANNHKYNPLDAGSKTTIRDTDIQNGLREWQFEVAAENGLDNIAQINKNTQAWRAYSDMLHKSITGKSQNNAISLTDWIILSGGEPTNIALFLGKKVGATERAKQFAIRKLGNQKKASIVGADKDAILKSNLEKKYGTDTNISPTGGDSRVSNRIAGLLPEGSTQNAPSTVVLPGNKAIPLKEKTNKTVIGTQDTKGTPAIQATKEEQKALPEGKRVTPQTQEKAVIQESKKGLENTKFGTTTPDIQKPLQNLTTKNIYNTSNTIAKQLGVPVKKVQEVIKEFVDKYGDDIKNKLGELADAIADRTGARAKFVDDGGKSLDDFKEVGTTESAKLSKIESYYKNKTGSDDVFDIMERFKKSSPENQEKVLKKASEFNVLDNYTSHQGRINSYLRKPEGTHLQETVNKANATIEEIRKLPKYEGEVYRGVSKYDGLDDLRIGDTFSDKAILSSSKSKIVADRFADDVMFEIESKKGRDLGDIGAMKSEQEVVFLPETKFSIKDIIKKKNKTIIKMTEE